MVKKGLHFEKSNWSDYAECYDLLNLLKPYREMQKEIALRIASLQPRLVLDAGCGTGNFELYAFPLVHNAFFFGLDGEPSMLKIAKRKCFPTKAFFALGNLNKTFPCREGTFDVVVSVNVLYSLDNPDCFLREAYRSLAIGGTIILVTPKIGHENGLILREHSRRKMSVDFWLNVHKSPDHEKRAIEIAFEKTELVEGFLKLAHWNRLINQTGKFVFMTSKDLSQRLRQAGFRVVDAKKTYAGQSLFVVGRKE